MTERAPHLLSPGECWAVWKDTEGKRFMKEEDMSCKVPPPSSAQELVEKAPPKIFVDSGRVRCMLEKQPIEQLSFGRPIYMKADYYCLYNAKLGGWALLHKKSPTKADYTSFQTNVYSPHLCLWRGDGDDLGDVEITFEEFQPAKLVRGTVAEDGELWVDPDFPPSDASIGEALLQNFQKKYGDDKIVWKRLATCFDDPVLFDDDEPFDLKQRGVGNCWLMSCFATLAEFGSHIKEQIFLNQGLSKNGRYELRLYDWSLRDWRIFPIDDYVPCGPSGTPLYAASKRALWGHLLEKVFAKQLGSYSMLPGHEAKMGGALALAMMTGGQEFSHFNRNSVGKNLWVNQVALQVTEECDPNSKKKGELCPFISIWEEEVQGKRMKYRCRDTPPSNPKFVEGLEEGWITTKTGKWNRLGLSVAGGWTYRHVRQGPHKDWYDATQYREVLEEVEGVSDQDFMWKKLLESDKANHAITLGLNPSDGRQDGLVSNHAYSLLRCVQVGEIKLLAIRNPWGHREWNGAWSDDSEEWQQHPEVAAVCQCESNDDGIFWMEFGDFWSIWHSICICMQPMATKRDISVQLDNEDHWWDRWERQEHWSRCRPKFTSFHRVSQTSLCCHLFFMPTVSTFSRREPRLSRKAERRHENNRDTKSGTRRTRGHFSLTISWGHVLRSFLFIVFSSIFREAWSHTHANVFCQWIYLHLLLEWKDDCFEVINAPFLSAGFFGRVRTRIIW